MKHLANAALFRGPRSHAAFLIAAVCIIWAGPSNMVAAQPAEWREDIQAAMNDERWDAAIRTVSAVISTQPDLLDARLMRAVAYREKAKVIFDEVRAQYFLDEQELKDMWRAARRSAAGEEWSLDVGKDYDVARAMVDFEFVLARDSGFKDVLHEYAVLWRDHDVFDRAIELAETQVRLDPLVPEAHQVLLATYRHYIAWTDRDEAIAWLERLGSAYSRYALGELYRRAGHLAAADSIYVRLLTEDTDVPAQVVQLSRAKLRVEQGRFAEAHAFVEESMRFETLIGARLLMDAFVFVFDPGELAEARSLDAVEAYADFFRRIWQRRDPVPASSINWRLIEHIRRLVVAEKEYAYFGPPSGFRGFEGARERGGMDHIGPTGGAVDYPETHAADRGFNDKGLVYIRHGEPDERVVTMPQPHPDPMIAGIDPNESWRYVGEGLEFHFLISTQAGTANSWPLVTYLADCHMADDRRHWGGLYERMAPRLSAPDPRDPSEIGACGPRREIEFYEVSSRMASEGARDIHRGLTTDRHTWPEEIESFDYPFDVVTFRGAEGETDVSVYFALPIGRFSATGPGGVVPVEVGFAIHDAAWRSVAEQKAERRYEPTDDLTAAAFEELHVRVPPDSYRVSLHADLLESRLLGGYQFDRRIPDYGRSATMMSDVLLAYDIRPKPGHTPTVRSSLRILPNPFHRVAVDQPLHVYFELYHLGLGGDGTARYEVSYELRPEEEGGILGLFRRTPPGLSVSAGMTDETPSPIVFSQIDVSELAAGTYDLTIRVTDTVTGKVMERIVPVTITERGASGG